MSLDRSWLRRALSHPPHFGRTLPDLWMDGEVTFSRTEVRPDGYGGFSGSTSVEYLTSRAHVRRSEGYVGAGTMGGAATGTGAGNMVWRRRLDIRIPYPELAEDMPVKGDFAAMTLDNGVYARLAITDVKNPRDMGDHLHVICEEFG